MWTSFENGGGVKDTLTGTKGRGSGSALVYLLPKYMQQVNVPHNLLMLSSVEVSPATLLH